MSTDPTPPSWPRWRTTLHEIIFEAETPAGKAFDIALIISVLLSIIAVMLESVRSIRVVYGELLYEIELFFTILFTIEYFLRLITVRKPLGYATSFFGVVDLLAILPTFLSLLVPGTQYLFTVRVLRLLRVFRVLKLTEYLAEAGIITTALKASRRKISVFILAVLSVVVIVGSLMYIIEGEGNGFTDIPTSMYWAIVTLTTVGYGDISPQTGLGKALASMLMLMGYGILAVPTGIVTVELSKAAKAGKSVSTQSCPNCSREGHDEDAAHCKYCGERL